jgi:hypothetical protein
MPEFTTRFPDGSTVTVSDDVRYWFATCRACGKRWQLIDWRCALHREGCAAPQPTATECSPR